MGVVTLHPLEVLRLKVSCAVQQVGEGLAVVVVVVVKEKLWRISQSLCFRNYLIPGVESASILWDLVADEN